MHTQELTNLELAERVAVLKRFRSLLKQQRSQFREYLQVLERQEKSITEENADAIVRHTELEESILSNIFTMQKVIDPLETLYNSVCDGSTGTDVPKLKAELEHLQAEVLDKNKKNRELLQTHLAGLRKKLAGLKRPYAHNESIYAQEAHRAGLVDLSL